MASRLPVRTAVLALLALTMGASAAAVAPISALAAPAEQSVQAPQSCAPAVALVNGGFESPAFGTGIVIVDQSAIPGWSTTASDGQIEIWHVDTPAAGTGDQHAELNANQVSTLYQDVATIPGQLLRWQLQHRGRAGTDVMRVQLGAPGGVLVQQGPLIADGNTAWGSYSGLYTVPAGQTVTRFAFVSVSSTGGASLGNFLDSLSLGTAACLVTTKTVANLTHAGTTAVAGDVLEYTVTSANQGGVPAASTSVSDVIPAGATFVPGSTSTSDGAMTDAAGDDAGEQAAGTVTARLGDGADATSGGSIPAGESRSLQFRVTVDADSAGLTLVNSAEVSFVETLTSTPSVSTSTSTSTAVLGTADLQVTQTLDTALVSGEQATYTITAANGGPQPAAGTELVSALPFPGMSTADPDCQITGTQLTCLLGTIVAGATHAVVVSGIVPATGGVSAQLLSSISGSVFDPDLTNNTASTTTTIPVIESIAVDITLTDFSGAPSGPAHPGDHLQATYVVTNTGNVGADALTVTDPVFGPVTCTPTALAPAETAVCSADSPYLVTTRDDVIGSVTSTATARATSTAAGTAPLTAVDAAAMAVTASAPLALSLTGSSPSVTLGLGGALTALGLVAVVGARSRRRMA